MFCLNDVARALEISNPRDIQKRLNVKGVATIYTPTEGGTQPMTYINESNLYKCIFQSRKEEAERFQEWVTSEVLPTIRRTGGYLGTTETDTPEEIMAKALKIADQTMKDQKQRLQMLEGETERQREEIARLAPKAKYTDEVLQSPNTYTFTEMAKELRFRSVGSFIKKLTEKGILFKKCGTLKLLTAKYSEFGYTTVRTSRFFHQDGTPDTRTITVWTETWRAFLNDLKSKGFFYN